MPPALMRMRCARVWCVGGTEVAGEALNKDLHVLVVPMHKRHTDKEVAPAPPSLAPGLAVPARCMGAQKARLLAPSEAPFGP